MRVVEKFTLLLVLPFFAAALSGVAGIVGLHNAKARLNTVYADRTVASGLLAEVLDGVQVVASDARESGKTGPARRELRLRADAAARRTADSWAAYLKTYLTPEEAHLVARADAGLKAFLAVRQAIADAPPSDAQLEQFLASSLALRSDLLSLIELQSRVAKAENESAKREYAWIVSIVAASIIACLFMGAALSWLLFRTMRRERRSQRLIQGVIDEYPAIVFVKDPQGRLVLTNRAYDQFFDLPPGAAVGRTDFEIIPHDAAMRVREVDSEVLSTGRAIEVEEHVPGAEGPRVFMSTKFPLIDDGGKPYSLCGIAVDVTQRRRAERRIFFNQKVVETAGPVLWIDPQDRTVVYANPAALEHLGRPMAQVVGADILSFDPDFPAERMAPTLEILRSSSRPYVFESRHLRGDGSLRDVEIVAALAEDEERTLIVTWISDITERKRTEAALRESEMRQSLAIEGGDLGTWQYVVKTGALTWSERTLEMFGLPGDTPRTRKELYERVHPDDREPVKKALAASLQGEPFVAAYRVIWDDGSAHLLSARGRMYYGDDGTPLHVSGTTQDVTEPARVQEELKRAKVAADAASAAKSRFLANMSHEIRTPMNAILGMSHLALKGSTDAATRGYLEKIQIAGHHLLGVINDILDISRIEAGQLTVERLRFRMTDLWDNIANVVAGKAIAKGLPLAFEVAPDVPQYVVGDQLRLGQVLINYVDNAIKFTEQGSIRIAVEVLERSKRGLVLRFSVQDKGIGLSRGQMEAIFEAFRQGDSSTTRRYGGTGLGLAISKSLVALMGGEVGVESEPGQGSTFWFTVQVGLYGGQMALPHSLPPAPLEAALHGARVLLVEDNEFNQEVAKAILSDVGLAVDVAGDGQQALNLVRERYYDLVLMDLQMPVMDGLTATREIRMFKSNQRLPIVAMTANVMQEERQSCLEAGMDDFVAKPIDPDELLAVLQRWIEPDPR